MARSGWLEDVVWGVSCASVGVAVLTLLLAAWTIASQSGALTLDNDAPSNDAVVMGREAR